MPGEYRGSAFGNKTSAQFLRGLSSFESPDTENVSEVGDRRLLFHFRSMLILLTFRDAELIGHRRYSW
jgi:hypothetical protein